MTLPCGIFSGTFFGKLSITDRFVKGPARLPGPRKLETSSEKTNHDYLRLLNDDDLH